MAANTWSNTFDPPDFSGYAHSSDLIIIVIVLAVVTCSCMLSFLCYRQWQLHRIESAKTRCLTLAALVRNSQGRILATLADTLPSVVIDTSAVSAANGEIGFGAKGGLSLDFMRMLKISFNWPSRHRYARHLTKLHANGAISLASSATHSHSPNEYA